MTKKMKYVCLILPAFILALSVLGGCSSHEAPPMTEDVLKKELFGKVWKVQDLFNRDVMGDNDLTLEFLEDGTVKGSGGCNNFSGKYALDGEKLTFGPMMSTKKSCGAAADEQEYTYLTFLAQIETVRLVDGTLELHSHRQGAPMVLTTGESGGFLW